MITALIVNCNGYQAVEIAEGGINLKIPKYTFTPLRIYTFGQLNRRVLGD
jgi:hypothetical protein